MSRFADYDPPTTDPAVHIGPAADNTQPHVNSGLVLVVGGGFIGSHVVETLIARGVSTRVVTRSRPKHDLTAALNGADLVLGDIGEPLVLKTALAGAEHVIYCAGGLTPADSAARPLADLESSLPPLLSVLEGLRAMSGVGITYLSSGGTVYGEPIRVPVDEDHPTEPITPYGITKLAAEKYVSLYRRLYGIPSRILRCSNVYGERQRADRNQGAVAVFMRRIIDGQPIKVVGDGSVVRDYIYVRDLAAVVASLIGIEEEPSLLNVGSGEGASIRELIELIRQVTGLPVHVEYGAARPFDVRRSVLDISRLRSTVPYHPTPLRDGLDTTWRSLDRDHPRTFSVAVSANAKLMEKEHRREGNIVDLRSAAPVNAERTEREQTIDELSERLEEVEASLTRATDELTALRQLRTFRYSAPFRNVYGRLRQRIIAQKEVKPSLAPVPGLKGASIDIPEDGGTVDRDLLVPVVGWAVLEKGPITSVRVLVNGVDHGKARLGLARADIAAAIRRPEAHVCGFQSIVDLSNVQADHATIEAWVESLNGDRHRIKPVTVKIPPQRRRSPTADPVRDRSNGSRNAKASDGIASGEELKLGSSPKSSAAIRLLVFTHHLGLGGGQLYLFELLRLLSRKKGVTATLVAPADGALRSETEALGIPVVIRDWHSIKSIAHYETRQAEFADWARAQGFNTVLANTLFSFPGVDLAARLGLPAIWAVHESLELPVFWREGYGSPQAVHPLVRMRAEAALESAAAVVFEADATRRLFERYGDPRRFVTVPYGIDFSEIERYAATISQAEARRRLRLPDDATVLLCLGTIEPRKGQALLAEAFRVVARDHPYSLLAFVGSRSDPPTEALRNYVQGTGLGRRILVEPITPDTYLWYRAASALICASDVESLPRTVLEAMAFEVPIIATRVFGLAELLSDGMTGYLCEPRDLNELVSALDRFLRASPDERLAVAQAGRLLVRERHDSRGYADAYHRLLSSLIDDPNVFPGAVLQPQEGSGRLVRETAITPRSGAPAVHALSEGSGDSQPRT